MRERRFHMKKRTAGIVIAGAVVVATAGGAFAYWTTLGDGSGSATAASENGTVTLHAAVPNGLTPGASGKVTFTADNPGTSSLFVTTITLASVTVDDKHAGCDVADFTMPDVASDTRVLAGAYGQPVDGVGTLTFADTKVNQDACKGAEITLHLTSS